LYYFALFLMVEIDARKFRHERSALRERRVVVELDEEILFHFLSLVSINRFMLYGYSRRCSRILGDGDRHSWRAFLHRDTALFSYDLFRGAKPNIKGIFQSNSFNGASKRARSRAQRRVICPARDHRRRG